MWTSPPSAWIHRAKKSDDDNNDKVSSATTIKKKKIFFNISIDNVDANNYKANRRGEWINTYIEGRWGGGVCGRERERDDLNDLEIDCLIGIYLLITRGWTMTCDFLFCENFNVSFPQRFFFYFVGRGKKISKGRGKWRLQHLLQELFGKCPFRGK